MNKIKEIIRQKEECNLSYRQIARGLNISRPVVKQYYADFMDSGLKYREIINMPDDELFALFEKNKCRSENDKYKQVSEKFEYFATELKRKGVRLQTLWEEYIKIYPDSYSYSRFCYHYQVWRGASDVSMHIEHKVGDKLYVDYAGYKFKIFNQKTNKEEDVETFVAILGASQYTYVEASKSQKKEDWIKSNDNALHYFKGAPKAIVPDCLKSAINKADKYEPDINPEFADFASYYGVVILPARPAKPKDKPLVENMVSIIYTRIYAPLRNRIFYSIEELNEAIWNLLEDHNKKVMKKYGKSRKELFEEVEKSSLTVLPTQRYEFRKFLNPRVQFNYHFYLSEDKHYYSVPWKLKGKRISVFYTETNVEAFYNNIRIASYKREREANAYTTKTEHMPSNHRFYAEWNPERIKRWASEIGENVRKVVEKILSNRTYAEQGFRACIGIISLAKKYGIERLDKACVRAINFNAYSYRAIKNILSKGLDKAHEEQLHFHQQLPIHENVRGNTYFN